MLTIFTLAQVASLITLVFPVAARYSVNLALTARLVLGWFCPVFFGLHGLFYCSSRFSVPICKTISSQTSGTLSRKFQFKKANPWMSNFSLFWKLGGLVKKHPVLVESTPKCEKSSSSGIFHAVAFPAMTGAWGAWAPPLEKTQLMGIYFSGAVTLLHHNLFTNIGKDMMWCFRNNVIKISRGNVQ